MRSERTVRTLAASALLLLAFAFHLGAGTRVAVAGRAASDDSAGCVACHAGIEPMHPEAGLTCVGCHGGDGSATDAQRAHVQPPAARGEDDSTAPEDRHLAWRRFRNPMDLRVAESTCGECHGRAVASLLVSLHGTTAGHLSDGYYEMGLSRERGSRFSVFDTSDPPIKGGAVERLRQVPGFDERGPLDALGTHFTDLPRKECMQCHLWSQGRAVRGRVGFDGDYRGEGCAACHVEYALDGLSSSGDRQRVRGEPGHPLRHAMTGSPGTDTCVSCHYGDASIGLNFRGLSQLPPAAPGGPETPGTTDRQLNRTFYLNDPTIVPPDVHHERGMHCIDCHTLRDVMGDGRMHGQMEHAVEISCEACHGTFDEPATLRTERGTPLDHLSRSGDRVVLTSKVTGKEHDVPQAVHVLEPGRPEYNPRAAAAMKPEHAELECYVCHGGWNPNFLGFHFSRNASLTQLDLLSGQRTPGRVTTQEKVFATWKSFYAGRNERGAIAPYLTGFSTMGSVWDEEGRLLLDQVMPETAAGLSGMTMIHHQLHTTRPTARQCVECHRSPATWGLGSPNFRLARQLAFVADRRGIEVVGLVRTDPLLSVALCKFPLPDVVDLALACDPIQGHATYLYAAEGGSGVHVLDVRDPLAPRRVAFVATIDPRDLALQDDHLYVADGVGGVRVLDVSVPAEPRVVGSVATFDARQLDLSWPTGFLADGVGGLAVLDLSEPSSPRLVSSVDANSVHALPNETVAVESLFQYSRPTAVGGAPADLRTPARLLLAVLDRRLGLFLYDATDAARPVLLYPRLDPDTSLVVETSDIDYRGLVLRSQVDAADAAGGQGTRERDYVYLLLELTGTRNQRSVVRVVDVSDPTNVVGTARTFETSRAGQATEAIVSADVYNPPFRTRYLLAAGATGLTFVDATTSADVSEVGRVRGLRDAYAVVVEEFPLDRMVRTDGTPLKDVSHAGSRWLGREEIERVLDVPAVELGFSRDGPPPPAVGETALLHLERFDRDGSGRLEGEEIERAGSASADADGDGRVTLFELALANGLLEGGRDLPEEPAPAAGARVFRDGDLARLLDGVDPFRFDDDRDGELDRDETEDAFFSALDLDGDEVLSLDELSRYPGPLRRLRYGDEEARRALRAYERRADGRVTRREFHLEGEEWEALDVDGDGELLLREAEFRFERERGHVAPGSEWPTRREHLFPLPPSLDPDGFFAFHDADGDGVLERSELDEHPELFRKLDHRGKGSVTRDEVRSRLRPLLQGGTDGAVDDFVGRWDRNGSGEVEPEELPELVRLRLARFLPRGR